MDFGTAACFQLVDARRTSPNARRVPSAPAQVLGLAGPVVLEAATAGAARSVQLLEPCARTSNSHRTGSKYLPACRLRRALSTRAPTRERGFGLARKRPDRMRRESRRLDQLSGTPSASNRLRPPSRRCRNTRLGEKPRDSLTRWAACPQPVQIRTPRATVLVCWCARRGLSRQLHLCTARKMQADERSGAALSWRGR